MSTAFDVIIIGGGPAGYTAAVRAAQKGARVALFEADGMGGTCLNRGCIPTKFFWEALHLKKRFSRAADYGLSASVASADFASVRAKKDKTVALLTKGVRALCASYGVTIIDSSASFRDKNTIESAGQTYTASKIIITAGSRPRSIGAIVIDHASILDSTDILSLLAVPSSLLVVGGGAIGIELAYLMAGFGCRVRLIEKETQLLPNADIAAADECKKILQRQGVEVHLGITSIDEHRAGFEKILIAAGRQPNVESLNLEAAGVAYTAKGIAVNEYLETNVSGIYAAGDVTGRNFLAYIAQAEGAAAAENALGDRRISAHPVVPWAVFTDPPVAAVGMRSQDMQPGIRQGIFPLSANSKAFIENERTGWVKTITSADDTVLGVTIVAPNAPDMIAHAALAVANKLSVHDLTRDQFFHPSLAESFFGALECTHDRCTELPKSREMKSDSYKGPRP